VRSRFTQCRHLQLLFVLAAVCVHAALARKALANATFGADVGFNTPIAVRNVGSGFGLGLRLGTALLTEAVVINPEIAFNYAQYSRYEPPTLYRGLLGVRAGLGNVLRLGIIGHFGFCYVSWDRAYAQHQSNSVDLSQTTGTYDFGGFIEVHASPEVAIGLFALYSGLVATAPGQEDPLRWAQIGGQLTLYL
jgi:hypothetical protein